MESPNYLTIHSLTALPWHNLNRDDRGLPKSMREGGYQRGMLSAQSLKRAARINFESSIPTAEGSIRSRKLDEEAVKNAKSLAQKRGSGFDETNALKEAKSLIKKLTASDPKEKLTASDPEEKLTASERKEKDAKDTITWLSREEFGALVDSLAKSGGQTSDDPVTDDGKTASLAIAAFGRMFTKRPTANVEAAISVGPAVTTHPISIEIDYFTAVDDLAHDSKQTGSGYLGQNYYTSGVYFRSFTIDRGQLRRNWTGWDAPNAEERLQRLVEALIISLPSGKTNTTAPLSLPTFILAEQQTHRFTYQFHTPVRIDEDGGYLEGSINRLIEQAEFARKFDPSVLGNAFVVDSSVTNHELPFPAESGNINKLADFTVSWLRND